MNRQTQTRICWGIWLGGFVLVVLSWFDIVSARTGWTGFWVATAIGIVSRLCVGKRCRGEDGYIEDDIRRFISEITELIDRGDEPRGDLLVERGKWRQSLAEWDESIADFSEAIEVDSQKEGQARYWRGIAFYQLGQFRKCKDDVTFVIENLRNEEAEHKNYHNAMAFRSFASLHLEQWDDTINDTNELIAVDSTNTKFHIAKGQALIHKTKFDAALASFQEARSLDSECAEVWHGISYILACCPDHRLRDGVKAVLCSERACELTDWSEWSSIGGLAAAYAEVGEFEKAVHYAERALELAPERESCERRERIEQYRQCRPYRHSKSTTRIRPGRFKNP